MCAAKIKDGLFIGDEETSKDPEFLDLNKISNLVNVAGREVNNAWSSHGLVYLTYNWEDRDDYNLFDRKGGEELITDLIEFVDTSLRHGVSVLIFSKRGVGRSAVAVIVYLMCKYHWGFEKTFAFVAARKIDIELNDGFIRQLLALDKRIRSCCQQLLQQQLQLLNSFSSHHIDSNNNDRLYEAIEVMRWKDWDVKYLDMERQLLQIYLRNNPNVSIAQLTKSLPIPSSSPLNGKREFHNSAKLMSLLKVIPADELVLVNSFNNSQRTLTALPGPYLQAIQIPKNFRIKFKSELDFAPAPLSPSSSHHSASKKFPSTSVTPARSALKGARQKLNTSKHSPETHNEYSTDRHSAAANSRDYFSHPSADSKGLPNYDPPSSKHGNNYSPDSDRLSSYIAESKSKANNSAPSTSGTSAAAAASGSNNNRGGDPSLLFRESKNGIIDYEDFLRYRASTASLNGTASATVPAAGGLNANRYVSAASPTAHTQQGARSPNKPYDEGHLNHHHVAKVPVENTSTNSASNNANGNSNGANNSNKPKFNDDFDALLERSEAFVNELNNQRKSSTIASSNNDDDNWQPLQSRKSAMSQSAPLSASEQRLQSLVKRIEDSKTPHFLAGLPVPQNPNTSDRRRSSNNTNSSSNNPPSYMQNTHQQQEKQPPPQQQQSDRHASRETGRGHVTVNGWTSDHNTNTSGNRNNVSRVADGSDKSAVARSMSSLEMMQQQGVVKARHDLLGSHDASFNLNTSLRQSQQQQQQQQQSQPQSSQRKFWVDSNLADLVNAQQGNGRNSATPSPRNSIQNSAPKVFRHGSPMLGRSSGGNTSGNHQSNANSKVRASTSSLGSYDNNTVGSNDFHHPSSPFSKKMNTLSNIYGVSNISTPGRATTPSAGMYRSASPSVRQSASSLPNFPADNKQRSGSAGAGGMNRSRNTSFNDLSSVGSNGNRASSSNLRDSNTRGGGGSRPGTPTRAWRF